MSTVDELTRYLKELTALAAGRVFPPASSGRNERHRDLADG